MPPPLLSGKRHHEASVFTPENLLREARRQLSVPEGAVAPVCVLDPDGDILRYLDRNGRLEANPNWACYHTTLHDFSLNGPVLGDGPALGDGLPLGIIGCAVGASFAVLLAEQLFASGCRLLISVTSSGQILSLREPPYFILIEKALRDEGTSYHYLPAAEYVSIPDALLELFEDDLPGLEEPLARGAVWTTDAPFRETRSAIELCRSKGILAVEMEAAALYAFARARGHPVICFAHITNRMASAAGDFEKGAAAGSIEALRLIQATASRWLAHNSESR
ncbi:MAG: nucleoside phosphorylase [Proteobacteria bacterium]|nr:nucleoside phosphorylase [Pseudomonadota bacterium]